MTLTRWDYILVFRYQDMNISACTSGRGQLILSDHEGALYFLDRQMELKMFRAYEIRVSHLHQMKQHNILVTVGVGICEFKKWGLWPIEKPVLSSTCHMLLRPYMWEQNIKYLLNLSGTLPFTTLFLCVFLASLKTGSFREFSTTIDY